MDVIPAIDLLAGRCVRLTQGDYQQVDVFGDDPLGIARQWVADGATRLHLVDLDGAKAGRPVNQGLIRQIVQDLAIPVQVGGGIRTQAAAEELLGLGVDRLIVGTLAVREPDTVAQWCRAFPNRIWVGLDARNGYLATQGWTETSTLRAVDLAQTLAQQGVGGLIYTDILKDGTLEGPNLTALRELAMAVDVPIIASGGVSSIPDLFQILTLEALGVRGVIVGKALYTGALTLKEAHRAVGPGRWQDVPPDLDSSAFA
ncbi:MAG: 1-(5-phosphoribosyl)-5-[(5-phosphoribosylamino)methylideneamino]imidazole-4-carboxamide isomerase [Gloeomargaritaceae cyanobacterium C42_A2020_066]|nr:1-(5-phosphoribosyl)-5-[(5-phosphoribosylamino)methylideneamino]imidazole-4-carboxamide isomerase [Gloeomargaritaceae cyanobacterium C42_A2020_066]